MKHVTVSWSIGGWGEEGLETGNRVSNMQWVNGMELKVDGRHHRSATWVLVQVMYNGVWCISIPASASKLAGVAAASCPGGQRHTYVHPCLCPAYGSRFSSLATLRRPLDTHLPSRLGVGSAEARMAALMAAAVGMVPVVLRCQAAYSAAAPLTCGVATAGREREGGVWIACEYCVPLECAVRMGQCTAAVRLPATGSLAQHRSARWAAHSRCRCSWHTRLCST